MLSVEAGPARAPQLKTSKNSASNVHRGIAVRPGRVPKWRSWWHRSAGACAAPGWPGVCPIMDLSCVETCVPLPWVRLGTLLFSWHYIPHYKFLDRNTGREPADILMNSPQAHCCLLLRGNVQRTHGVSTPAHRRAQRRLRGRRGLYRHRHRPDPGGARLQRHGAGAEQGRLGSFRSQWRADDRRTAR